MDVTTGAIWRALTTDPDLSATLPAYRGSPAVFTSEPVPSDAPLPCVVVSPPVSAAPADTKTVQGRVVRRDVRVYVDAGDSESGSLLGELSEQVRAVLHRRPDLLDPPGWTVVVAEVASGPVQAPAGPTVRGTVQTVELTLRPV